MSMVEAKTGPVYYDIVCPTGNKCWIMKIPSVDLPYHQKKTRNENKTKCMHVLIITMRHLCGSVLYQDDSRKYILIRTVLRNINARTTQ